MHARHPLFPVLSVIFATVLIQIGASQAKQLFPHVGAEGAAALRLLLAALMLNAFWRPWRHRLSRNEWHAISIYGMSIGGMNVLVYMALERIPLGIAVALEFIGPLAVALIASRKATDLIWVAFASLGIVLLLPVMPNAESLDMLGVAYALGAAMCWALYILYGQKAVATVPGGTATALGMGIAAILALPVGIATAGSALWNPHLLPLALSIALLSSVLPYSLEMMALKALPTKTFGILMSLEPAVAALSGMFFLHEYLTLTQWLAIVCVMAASAGSTLALKRNNTLPEV